MYTEDYENRGFPFRDFLLKLILIIIFVFLLVWLLPKFITPKVIENNISESSENTDEIKALGSQIFNDNLERMKEAAINYYTDERLPKEIGESDTMTLSDMIGKKIITALIDKNNKAVDVEKSYVKITKADDEYILKVNIKDSTKEDYILVHLGCYTYCDSYICEKEETEIIIKGEKPNSTTKTTSKPAVTSTPTTRPTSQPSDTTEPDVTPTPSDVPEPDVTPTPQKSYLYEYEKTTGVEFSAWTSWSSWEKTSCNTQAINCNDNSTRCLQKLQLYSRKEKIGTYKKKYVATYNELVQTGSYTKTTCSNYNYVIVNNTTYTTSTTYDVVKTITSATASSKSDWKYSGRASYANPPRDTATTHYEFVGADYSYCNETCTSLPNFYYDKYTYIGSMKSVANTISTPTTSSTGSSTSTSVSASCGSYITTEVPIYSTISKSYVASRTEPLYGTVCYKSTKTRRITDPGKTQYKWSYYNDTSLLNKGWKYTGSSKLAS